MNVGFFLSLMYLTLQAAEYTYELTSKQLSPLQASLKVEFAARFPHFVNELLYDCKGERNTISYDSVNKLYQLSVDNRLFMTKAIAINHKEKEVLWAGGYTKKFINDAWQDGRPFINLMMGYLRQTGYIEMRPALLCSEVVDLKITPNHMRLISLYQQCDQMFIRSLCLESNDLLDVGLNTPSMAFDISRSSKYLVSVDEEGLLFRCNIKNLVGSYHEVSFPLKNICYGYDDQSIIGISDVGAHYIQFLKSKSRGISSECPRMFATHKGRYKNIWRGTGLDSYVVQDCEGQYHELNLKRPEIIQENDNENS